jgi:cytochrome b561
MLLLRDTSTRFGLVSVVLHWYVAAAVLFLMVTGFFMYIVGDQGTLRPVREDLMYFHASIAVTSVPFFLYRIFWRVRSGHPRSHNLKGVANLAAETVWRLLLLLIVWQLLWAVLQEDLHWFEIRFGPRPTSVEVSRFAEDMHRYGALAIAILLFFHIGGALKHHFVDRDGVLLGMLRPVVLGHPKSETNSQVFTARADQGISVSGTQGESL